MERGAYFLITRTEPFLLGPYMIFSGCSRGGSRAETPPDLHHVSCAESRRSRAGGEGGELAPTTFLSFENRMLVD